MSEDARVTGEAMVSSQTATPENSRDTERPMVEVRQKRAIEELVRGRSAAQAARAVGVDRTTIYRWLRQPAFRARLNQWRDDVEEHGRSQLYAMVDAAARNVKRAIRKGDLKTSTALLRELNILAPAPRRSHDPAVLEREAQLKPRQERVELVQTEESIRRAELHLDSSVSARWRTPIPPPKPLEEETDPAES